MKPKNNLTEENFRGVAKAIAFLQSPSKTEQEVNMMSAFGESIANPRTASVYLGAIKMFAMFCVLIKDYHSQIFLLGLDPKFREGVLTYLVPYLKDKDTVYLWPQMEPSPHLLSLLYYLRYKYLEPTYSVTQGSTEIVVPDHLCHDALFQVSIIILIYSLERNILY